MHMFKLLIYKITLTKVEGETLFATVETVLLYGAETRTLTNALKKKLDGCYTQMLRMALNKSWKSHNKPAALWRSITSITEGKTEKDESSGSLHETQQRGSQQDSPLDTNRWTPKPW